MDLKRIFFLVQVLLLVLLVVPNAAFSYGEIFSVRGPEEIPESDDFTLLIAASPKEKNIDRVIACDIPAEWKVVEAYAVEAGSQNSIPLARAGFITSEFAREDGRQVIVFADTMSEFDPDANGVAYFVVIQPAVLSSASASVVVKSALVERINPDSPPEIDRKTKKPKPRNTNWKIMSPFSDEFSFAKINSKRHVLTIRLIKGWQVSRALTLDNPIGSKSELRVPPQLLTTFFKDSFAVEFWYRSTRPGQTIVQIKKQDETAIGIVTTPIGQIRIAQLNKGGGIQRQFYAGGQFISDGAWHHILLNRKGSKLEIAVDGTSLSTVDLPLAVTTDIVGLVMGTDKKPVSYTIDELRLLKTPYKTVTDILPTVTTNARDTLNDAFALFHFDEFGFIARSSVPGILAVDPKGKPQYVPMLFVFDSTVRLGETSSPLQSDRVLLNADLSSPTKVNMTWKATSEIGVKEYTLERRVGSFGSFEKTITVPAKFGSKGPKRGQQIIHRTSYGATESLPQLNGDIELYYRVAVLDYNGDVQYSEPIKLEYGGDRDVFVEQNQPNPFNPSTTIAFRLTKATSVKLAVYDIIGREVSVLVNSKLEAGRHAYELDATLWPGGIYFYKVKTAKTTVTRKMVLAK